MIVHRYWTGSEKPKEVARADATWFRLYEDVRLWTDEDLPTNCKEWMAELMGLAPEGDELRHQANLVRLWLLRRYGGLWADADALALRSLQPFLAERPAMAQSRLNLLPSNSVLYAPEGDEWIEEVLIRLNLGIGLDERFPAGAPLLQEASENFDVQILPAQVVDADPNCRGDGAYVVHSYMTTKGQT